jgi:hypothetical protein
MGSVPIYFIIPATVYIKTAIPAELVPDSDQGAGIQNWHRCRIESGMTAMNMFTCRRNKRALPPMNGGSIPNYFCP